MFSFNKHIFFSALTVVVLAVLVCFRFFGDIILHPDEFLFGPSGDGLKNYFTVAYQVIHGEGTWFNGMLYPYGDHLIYADGQPLLVKILKWFIDPEVNNGTQVIAVMNLLKIGSLVVTAWCVHRLLVWNYVSPWFAVPFALCIAFLSPQMARFIGHHALAYTCFIPMIWLLVESIDRYRFPWLMAAVSSILVLLSGFLHPYYVFIFAIFLGSILGWDILIKKFRLAKVENWAPRVFALIVPLILFMAYQKWVNPYTDRPASPSGTFHYMTTFQSIFIPVAEPFRSLFNSYFFRIFIPGSWEGEAYIGMVASFTAFVSLFAMVKRAIKRKWKVLTHPVLPPSLKAAFIPGIITLLFSLGLFHQLGLQWLSEFITPLKQFRSLGRVAWIFYYVFSVWTVYHLYIMFRYFRSAGKGKYTFHACVMVGLCAFLWMLDAIVNIKFNKEKILNPIAHESFTDHYANQWRSAGVRLEDHQAILPLPLNLVGSEKIGLIDGKRSLVHSMRGSFSTGIPILGGAMSRTSFDVTEKSAQLVADPLIPKMILDDMNPEKKLLLLRSDEKLTDHEIHWIENASLLYENPEYQLYSITIDQIKSMFSQKNFVSDSIEKFNGNPYLHVRWGSVKEKDRLWGANAYSITAGEPILDTVFEQPDTLILSFWIKVAVEESNLPNRSFFVDGLRKTVRRTDRNPNLFDGWLLTSDTLVAVAQKNYQFALQSNSSTVSRVMLRKMSENVFHEETGKTYFNNIPLEQK